MRACSVEKPKRHPRGSVRAPAATPPRRRPPPDPAAATTAVIRHRPPAANLRGSPFGSPGALRAIDELPSAGAAAANASAPPPFGPSPPLRDSIPSIPRAPAAMRVPHSLSRLLL
ncbi:hypothetical protein ACJRO7_010047 [Eucalyptus globulus]|uniref:Uncharacterized protein n=1 Tax=Eucalyptus globulus TaxID=34317 RepID=A0ABD3LG87_EUCGL